MLASALEMLDGSLVWKMALPVWLWVAHSEFSVGVDGKCLAADKNDKSIFVRAT